MTDNQTAQETGTQHTGTQTDTVELVFGQLLEAFTDTQHALNDTQIAEMRSKWRARFNNAAGKPVDFPLDTRRNIQDLEDAHNLLQNVTSGRMNDIRTPFDYMIYESMLATLCWTLRHHDTNETGMNKILRDLTRRMIEKGYGTISGRTGKIVPPPFMGPDFKYPEESMREARRAGIVDNDTFGGSTNDTNSGTKSDSKNPFVNQSGDGINIGVTIMEITPENLPSLPVNQLHACIAYLQTLNEPKAAGILSALVAELKARVREM